MTTPKINFNVDQIPDLSGKVAVVTGGNVYFPITMFEFNSASTGIGYETVKQLAKHGAQVYMASRTESKATAAIAQLAQEEPSTQGRVTFCHLDFADLPSVVSTADRLSTELDRLDILVNNAGVMTLPYSLTKDGIEIQFQSNHAGPFCFTQTLLPLLRKTAQNTNEIVRVVNVSSDAHNISASAPFSKPDFKTLKSANSKYHLPMASAWQRYAQSKLANLLYTKSFNEKYSKDNIWAIAIHPGIIRTELWKNSGLAKALSSSALVSPTEGAIPSLYAATSPEIITNNLRGAYITPGPKVTTPASLAANEKLANDLWALSENLLAEKGQKA